MKEEKKGIVIQFTGKSSSGKTSIAKCLAKNLDRIGYKVKVMDEHDYKATLNRDLGQNKEEKIEALHRLARFANIIRYDYDVIIISAINPYEDVRNTLRQLYQFYLVHMDCDNEILLNRNLHYNINQLIKLDLDLTKFDALDQEFEAVTAADLTIDTSNKTIKEAYEQLFAFCSLHLMNEEALS